MALFNIGKEGRIIIIVAGSDLLYIAMRTIEESSGLPEHPSPLRQLYLSLLQSLVTVVKGRDSLFEALAAVGEFIDFSGRGSLESLDVEIDFAKWDAILFHLRMEESCF
jgi:hypothetical protein